MKLGAAIGIFLTFFFGIHLLNAHCFRCKAKRVRPRVKIIKVVKAIPLNTITYAPNVQSPAIIIPPPIIQIPSPTIVQPPAIKVGAPTITLPPPAITERFRGRVTEYSEKAIVPTIEKTAVPDCMSLLQKFRLALDACEVRERQLQLQVLDLRKRLGMPIKEVPKEDYHREKEGPKERGRLDPNLKKNVKAFVTNKCYACHEATVAATRAGPNKYVIDFEKLTHNQGLYMLAKISKGEMPKMPNKFKIGEATEKELNDLEDYVDTLR